MLDKIVFRQSQVILLFSSACFFDTISSMYLHVLASTFSTDLDLMVIQRVVFSKRYTLSL